MTATNARDADADIQRELLRGMHPFDSQARPLAVIYVYGDISGTRQGGAMVAAAYYGVEKRWVTAERDWSDALSDAGAYEFHATDFFAGRGAFEGWEPNSPRHVAAAKRFASIAARHKLIGFAFGLDVPAYTELVGPTLVNAPRQLRRVSPRLFCTVGCLARISQMLREHETLIPHGERIAVCLEQEQGIGEIIDYFSYAKKRSESWTKLILSVAAVPKSDRQVQIADLLAHEMWRRCKDHLTNTTKPTRPTFDALVAGSVMFNIATKASCEEFAERLRDYGAQRSAD